VRNSSIKVADMETYKGELKAINISGFDFIFGEFFD